MNAILSAAPNARRIVAGQRSQANADTATTTKPQLQHTATPANTAPLGKLLTASHSAATIIVATLADDHTKQVIAVPLTPAVKGLDEFIVYTARGSEVSRVVHGLAEPQWNPPQQKQFGIFDRSDIINGSLFTGVKYYAYVAATATPTTPAPAAELPPPVPAQVTAPASAPVKVDSIKRVAAVPATAHAATTGGQISAKVKQQIASMESNAAANVRTHPAVKSAAAIAKVAAGGGVNHSPKRNMNGVAFNYTMLTQQFADILPLLEHILNPVSYQLKAATPGDYIDADGEVDSDMTDMARFLWRYLAMELSNSGRHAGRMMLVRHWAGNLDDDTIKELMDIGDTLLKGDRFLIPAPAVD